MEQRMRFWVITLIVIVCMTITMTKSKGQDNGVKWAFLIAGSKGYVNYRHQADVCHAYQVLKSGGLKDENIIVMMNDDIAYNFQNPYPGYIPNRPDGPNVYYNVPRDYTGYEATLRNFYSILRGDKKAIRRGSGKVLDTKPEDTIFIFFSGHGNTGILELPDEKVIYADKLVDTLKMKTSYKKMVIYLESCHAGSMFQGLLPRDSKIYVTTASNPYENSFAFYCPHEKSPPSPAYTVCLGDLYSISWLEDSEQIDRKTETLDEQYLKVWSRTYYTYDDQFSHVMRYGNYVNMGNYILDTYQGAGQSPENDNYHFNATPTHEHSYKRFNTTTGLVSQQDALLHYLKLKLEKASSVDKSKAQTELDDEISRRKHEDQSVHLIWKFLFGEDIRSIMMANLRSDTQPLVDDW
ncbi:vacuolar-processing enzyme-like, partial [Cicer arietinum]|uniref:legumain n=1 Tax=Cicer arietinum TaxID=3827 RepID=A0A1S2Z8T7_CICAR